MPNSIGHSGLDSAPLLQSPLPLPLRWGLPRVVRALNCGVVIAVACQADVSEPAPPPGKRHLPSLDEKHTVSSLRSMSSLRGYGFLGRPLELPSPSRPGS